MVKCDAHGIAACHSCSEYADHLERVNAALLEALERMTEAVDGYLHDPFKAEVAAARAAIALAKGK